MSTPIHAAGAAILPARMIFPAQLVLTKAAAELLCPLIAGAPPRVDDVAARAACAVYQPHTLQFEERMGNIGSVDARRIRAPKNSPESSIATPPRPPELRGEFASPPSLVAVR